MACRSEVVTDEGAFHKFMSIAALHTATQHLACPLTSFLRQATSVRFFTTLPMEIRINRPPLRARTIPM